MSSEVRGDRRGDGSVREQPTFGLWHHLRNPASTGRTTEQLYADSLEQAVWAEELGYGSYWLPEHHLSTDG